MKVDKHKKTVILIAMIVAVVVCACVIAVVLIVNKNGDSSSVPVEIVETKLKKPENLHVKKAFLNGMP